MSQQQQQPQTITLDAKNSLDILGQYIDMAQKHERCPFSLPESDILKRCRDLLLRGVEDAEINVPTAKNLFVQAIIKGQSKGCYSLDDAFILHKVCTYVSANLEAPVQPQQLQQLQQAPAANDDDSLSSLSDPVPLKSSGPRTV